MQYAYLLAQFERKIELERVPYTYHPTVGSDLDRMGAKKAESWTIIKVFGGLEELQLQALITLIGFEAAKKLFALELPEQKSYEQALTETVSRMGGEA